MTYDAVLMARRGLGADELRFASPGFMDAVRWAAYAQLTYEGTDELQAAAAQEPHGLTGAQFTRFQAVRTGAREEIKRRRVLLLLDEPDHVTGPADD